MVRVLLVDDEAVFRGSLAQRLRLRGYDVVDRGDGAAAIKAVEEDSRFDVIILDNRMPGKNGEEVLREIKRRRRSIPAGRPASPASFTSPTATRAPPSCRRRASCIPRRR